MELRRKHQRDDRRRRVLRDDGGTRPDETPPPRPRHDSPIAGRTYTDAARAELQPRLTDFLPQRPFAVGIAGLLILMFLAVPMGLDTCARSLLRSFPSHRQLLINGHDTCATWFASLCLLGCAALSLLVFNIRRHKLDDYRGRYGVWGWSTLLLLVASIDVATGIHGLAAEILTDLTGSSLRGDGSLWWLVLLASASSVTGLRVLIDMRQSRVSCGLVAVAATSYCVAASMHWHWWSPVPLTISGFVQGCLMLFGHASLCYALLLYARHVFLDAQGVLQVSAKRKRRSKTAFWKRCLVFPQLAARWKAWRSSKPPRKARAPRKSSGNDNTADAPAATTPHRDQPPAPDDELDDEELERLTDPNMPRSERRRLKKQQRRQQRQAA